MANVNTLRKLYGPAAMPTTPTVILTPTAGKNALIKYILMVNLDAAEQTVNLWINGSANGNTLLPPTPIQPNGRYEFRDDIIVLEDGDDLYADSTDADVVISIFGVEETL